MTLLTFYKKPRLVKIMAISTYLRMGVCHTVGGILFNFADE